MRDRPVPFVHIRCPRHRRMKPPPGVVLTVGGRWQDCKACRTIWREGMGPGARPAVRDTPPAPRPDGWPGRA
jgi:hypothetical protein